jgi:putative PIN family toxin of toxin-antitoxin system
MILVIDTCVIVSAFRSRGGASRILLDQVRTQPLRLAISSGLMMEYEAVLTRPEQMAVHRQSREEIERFLISLASFAKHVRSNYRYRPLLQDPNDEMVLEAAINGGAQAIATHNVRHFLPAATLFGIEILTPGRILEIGKLP